MWTRYDIYKGSAMSTSSSHGRASPMGFWTLSFIRSVDYTNDSLIVQRTSWPYNSVGIPTYALFLHSTWVVDSRTNSTQPNTKKYDK